MLKTDMVNPKKYILPITLATILLLAGILCIYALGHYHENTSSGSVRIEAGINTPRTMNHSGGGPPPMPGGKFPNVPGQTMPHEDNARGNHSANSSLTFPLTAYALIFLAIFILVYWLSKSKKMEIKAGDEKFILLFLILLGLLGRIYGATLMEGHISDMNLFKNWAMAAARNLTQFYSNSRSDYPPLYAYVLFIAGKVASITAMNTYFTLILKLPSIVADLVTGLVIFKLGRKYFSVQISLLLSGFYIFNPAVFINSTLWGQVDSFFTMMVVLSLWQLAEKRSGFAAALFTAAVLMKPQGIIFLPVLGFELIRQKNIKAFVKAGLCALVTVVAVVLPFALHEGVTWIFNLYAHTLSEYPYAAVNAFNFFNLLGANYIGDSSTLLWWSYHTWGMIFIVIITAGAWLMYIKGNNRAFAPAAALLLIAGVFIFSSRMHERYLFPAIALAVLACIYLRDKRLLFLATGFSITSYVNTYYVLLGMENSGRQHPVIITIGLLNIILFIYLIKVLWDLTVRKRTLFIE